MREASFSFVVTTALAPAEAWRRIVDVSNHGDVVPFTRGRGPRPEEARVGSRFVARTAVGPFGFDDVMEVREIVPGRRVVFEKVGLLIGGTIVVDVTSQAGESPEADCSRVAWRQSIAVPWLSRAPRGLRRVTTVVVTALAPVVGLGYEHVVRKVLDPQR